MIDEDDQSDRNPKRERNGGGRGRPADSPRDRRLRTPEDRTREDMEVRKRLANGSVWVASPAAGRCMSGMPFLLDGRVAHVEERYPSAAGLQSDALDIRFADRGVPCGPGILGTTVGWIEERIVDGRVEFIEKATTFNAMCGWSSRRTYAEANLDSRHMSARNIRDPMRSDLSDPITADDGIIRDDGAEDARTVRDFQAASDARRPSDVVDPGRAAFLGIVASGSWRTITDVCDRLWMGWQPEWGRRPSYGTMRRWVNRSRAATPADMRIVRLDRSPRRKAG